MGKPLICIPVIETSISSAVTAIKKAQNHADIVEIRADYIDGITESDVETLRTACTKPSVFTCRHTMEGGQWKRTEEERRRIVQKAFQAEFDYVDVELETIKEHAFPNPGKTKIIISHHDFYETPDYWDLTKIIDEMSSYSPYVYKIATLVKKEKDVTTLFRLLTNRQGKKMIVTGMGDGGKLVRILSPYLGSMFTFAAGDSGESAPGQINYLRLLEIYQLIEKTI